MADLNKAGIMFDIQGFSLHDGPGIRTLVFLKGCPLNCIWCANPEGKKIQRNLRYHSMKCASCYACIEACPHRAITKSSILSSEASININWTICEACTDIECADTCNSDALKIAGKNTTVGDIIRVIKRDKPYYRNNGGVTLSGGDPVYQHEFALEILKACKEEYIHTAIESAMFTKPEIVDRFLLYTDLFLTDIKHMNSARHKELTGVNNETILNNIIKLVKSKKVVVRVPIIPGLNDDEANILATASFCMENNISKINLLPYHNLGLVKYEQLGLEYGLKEIIPPEASRIELLKDLVQSIGVECVIG